jgi:serine protease Do
VEQHSDIDFTEETKMKTEAQSRNSLYRRTLTIITLLTFLAIGASIEHAYAKRGPLQDRQITTLRDMNQAFIDIVAEVKPTVVTVSTERVLRQRPLNPFTSDPFFGFFFGPQGRQPEQEYRQQGLGSGVIVSHEGYILTNNHVIDKADSIFVHTYDGRKYSARVIGTDPKTDVAVLKIDADGLDYIRLGNSDQLEVGEMVLAIGSPMSENLAYSVTMGIVSAKGRSNVGLADYEDFIQTDAAINPGNSGGPLVNLDGELVGLNCAIVSRSGGFQGIGFAVPVNMAQRVMNSLISEGRVVRGWLGVSIQDIDDQMADALGLSSPGGALVGDVLPDTPAEKAGIEAGDVIVAIDHAPVTNSGQLRSAIATTVPQSEVVLTLMRDGRQVDVPVVLGELPSDETAMAAGGTEETLGFAVSDLSDDMYRRYNIESRIRGVVVTYVDPAGAAYKAGLREGDVVQSLNRTRIDSKKTFMAEVGELSEGNTVLMRILRGGSGFFIAFEL